MDSRENGRNGARSAGRRCRTSRLTPVVISLFFLTFVLGWAPPAIEASEFALPSTEHLRVRCPRCKQPGHLSASCPMNRRGSESDTWEPPARDPEAERRESQREANRAQAQVLYEAGLEHLRLEKWGAAVDVFEQAMKVAPEEEQEKIRKGLDTAKRALDVQRKLRLQREQEAKLTAETKERVEELASSLSSIGAASVLTGEFMSDDPGRTVVELMSKDLTGRRVTAPKLSDSTEFKLEKPYLPVEDIRGETIGISSQSRGGVYRWTYAGWLPLREGERICHGDTLATDAQGHVRFRLADGTAFTVGPNSGVVLDDFVYDPDPTLKQTVFRVLKGVFRYVTGKVAKERPSNCKIKLPVGTIGIRGTDFIVELDADDNALVSLIEGEISISELNGSPGVDLKSGERVGIYKDGKVERVSNASTGQLELLWHCLAEAETTPLWAQPGTWGILLLVLGCLFGGIAIRRRMGTRRAR